MVMIIYVGLYSITKYPTLYRHPLFNMCFKFSFYRLFRISILSV